MRYHSCHGLKDIKSVSIQVAYPSANQSQGATLIHVFRDINAPHSTTTCSDGPIEPCMTQKNLSNQKNTIFDCKVDASKVTVEYLKLLASHITNRMPGHDSHRRHRVNEQKQDVDTIQILRQRKVEGKKYGCRRS